MPTTLYPSVEFKEKTWEIDEFDAASLYLLEGTEKAMLIDCGMGIGDLKTYIERMTDKPLIVVITHGHIDHTGNAWRFPELWINEKDAAEPIPQSLERRKFDTMRIAQRQKGSIAPPYNMFNLYPFDLNEDLQEPAPDAPKPVLHYLQDGQQFDLGGGRIVTAYDCPGHTKGEMVFLDEMTGTLFAGDALNYNLGIMRVPVETTVRYLKRLKSMEDRYDGIWNGHHDFRPLGMPLGKECLDTVIEICEDILAGHINPCEIPSFWGQPMPLTWEEHKPENPNVITLRKGRNFVNINKYLIHDGDDGTPKE